MSFLHVLIDFLTLGKRHGFKTPMREHNMTPEQLWMSGLLGISRSGNHIAKELLENLNEVHYTSYNELRFSNAGVMLHQVISYLIH